MTMNYLGKSGISYREAYISTLDTSEPGPALSFLFWMVIALAAVKPANKVRGGVQPSQC